MTTTAQTPTVRLAALAAALVPAFGAMAQDEVDMQKLTKPGSAIELGAGIVDKDNRRFGQYNGMVDGGGYGLVDFNLNRRDEATGNWLQITGRNVGLENRELRLDHRQQGNWGYFLEFSQIPRYSPYTVNTGLNGIGTGTVVVNGVPRRDVDINTTRDVWTVGANKLFAGAWDVQVRFRNEDKTGSRLWGRGTTGCTTCGPSGTGGFEFLADPIDYNTKQVEAILGYTGKSLQLSGGYYGTWFTNANTQLNSSGGTLAATTGPTAADATRANFQTMGLPPDNESHQLHLSGGYSFTPTTRGTFKVAYQRATQEDTFAQGFFVSGLVPSTVPLAPGVGTNLGGQVDTTLLQLGLTARPMPKLSVRADVRYNDRDDKTPLVQYFTGPFTGPPPATNDGFNEPRSIATTNGKLEASYMLPAAVRLTGGVDYELKERNTSLLRSVSFREETEELSYRAELRRTLSETLNGAVSFVRSDRDGSPWLTNTVFGGTVGSNLVHPLHLADRQRDRVRLSLDWTPVEKLALNFLYDQAKDDYSGSERPFGAQKGEAQLYTVDALYSFSENLQLNAWFSSADTKAEPETQMCENAQPNPVTGTPCPNFGAGNAADPVWTARMRNLAETFGIGLRGKPTPKLDLAAEIIYAEDFGQFIQTAITPLAVIPQIPDVTYKRTIFKLNAKYAVQKNSSVRFQYIYDQFKTNEWQWTTWTYTDGTTVRQEPEQRVNFAGISYIYEFR